MSAASKLAAYALALALALGGGAALGAAVGPVDTADAGGEASTGEEASAGGHGDHEEAEAGESPAPSSGPGDESIPGGVLTARSGYVLEPERTRSDGAAEWPFRFRITGPDGGVVEDFELRHERELHLIVVSRDLATFAHLHPSRDSSGTWTVPLPALAPGAYRAFADFAPAGGPDLTLGVDLAVPGRFSPAPLPEPRGRDSVDGYEVTLSGTPVAGSETEVGLEVRRGGEPVTDLEPYLGAFGHLVAIRAGDLAYLHVHPLGEPGDRGGPEVRFAVDIPSAGDYGLFFDFAHGGAVHTASFTIGVAHDGQAGATGDPETATTEEHH